MTPRFGDFNASAPTSSGCASMKILAASRHGCGMSISTLWQPSGVFLMAWPFLLCVIFDKFATRDAPLLTALEKESIEGREVRVRICVSGRRAVLVQGLTKARFTIWIQLTSALLIMSVEHVDFWCSIKAFRSPKDSIPSQLIAARYEPGNMLQRLAVAVKKFDAEQGFVA